MVSSDEEGASLLAGVRSGTGILEFSAARAGQDVTPADVEFDETQHHRKSPPLVLSALAGQSAKYQHIKLKYELVRDLM